MTKSRKAASTVAAFATLASSLIALTAAATPASAACQPPGGASHKYVIGSVSKAKLATNLRSDDVQGPGTATYNQTSTATTTVKAAAEAKADIGKWIAKASAKANVSLTKTWSKKTGWSYSLQIASGKTQHIRMGHWARKYPVTKYTWTPAKCKYADKAWTHTVITPVKSDSNVWYRENPS
ncbi:hypothetical protein QQM39_14495 [Streptomyces sp. DT2A-34]|uniref:hypothetical protein n=1 Tax=Streptomyces sp. DT2A-34 TaxID=3051182 RepID=UPI00265BE5C1|nr:hypothetical protein [Streptomyces sp. DT2A-34]MDO0912010.1 hypothetical protein [Streptomyces sp. DT2A-34]